MKFPYLKFSNPGGTGFFGGHILKPVIPIAVSSGPQSVRYGALVDSGADFCIFDAAIGETVGIDIRRGREVPFAGIQNAPHARGYLHEIGLNVGGWDYRTMVAFSYDIADHGYAILGQKGFFDIFVVKFDLAKAEIELKERKT